MSVEDTASQINVIFGTQHNRRNQFLGFMFP